MNNRRVGPAWLGALVGLWVAASTVLLAGLNNGRDQSFLDATNFIAGLPRMLFIEQFGIPRIFEAELLFLYCALVGALFGWLKSKDQPVPWVMFGILFIILIAGHWYALLAPVQGPISW